MTYLSVFPRDFLDANSPVIRRVVEKTIIGNFAPAVKPLKADSRVISIGSCFAQEIAGFLDARGLKSLTIPVTETMNSAFALDIYLAHYLAKEPIPQGFRGDPGMDGIPDDLVAKTLCLSEATIMTFGMSLCWFGPDGRITTEPPNSNMNSFPGTSVQNLRNDYYMRQTTVEENEAAIARCIQRVRAVSSAPIILTLSPVPLLGTRYDMPAVPANSLSKATLRVAIGAVMQKAPENVHYWPSYEIVTWFGAHIERAFGDEDRDARHVRQKIVDLIGDLFISRYVAS